MSSGIVRPVEIPRATTDLGPLPRVRTAAGAAQYVGVRDWQKRGMKDRPLPKKGWVSTHVCGVVAWVAARVQSLPACQKERRKKTGERGASWRRASYQAVGNLAARERIGYIIPVEIATGLVRTW